MFSGTRVPLQTLLDYLIGGETIDDFLEGFPAVTRAQVVAFLEDMAAAESTWAAELERRAAELESGTVEGVSWGDFQERLMRDRRGS